MRISDWSSDVCSSDLLERILAGHSKVTDGGESYAFSEQIKWATDHNFVGALDEEAVRRSAAIDFSDLAERYLASIRSRAQGRPFLTEKLPSNFLTEIGRASWRERVCKYV